MQEHVHSSLQFVGDWPWWAGVSGSVVLAAASWFLYRRDVAGSLRWLRWSLPALRSLAVGMITLMLSGPVLHHRKVIGELSRLLLLVDSSRSMGLTDASMDLGRKLRILQKLGFLHEGAVKMELPKAGESLADAQALAQKAAVSLNAETSDWNRLLTDFSAKMTEARDFINQAGNPGGRLSAFESELVSPAQEIARREMKQIDDRQRAVRDLARLAESSIRWQAELSTLFAKSMEGVGDGLSPVQAALKRFDAMPRWERLQAFLLEGEHGKLLETLAGKHEVQLFTLNEGAVQKIWEPTARGAAMPTGLAKPEGNVTDLATPLQALASAGGENAAHGAVVVLSDGQHNEGASPLEAARVLGGRQLPVYTIGFGSTAHPHDLAVVKVDAPEAVFAEDHVRGQIILKDDMPAGEPFTLTIKDGDNVLWEQKLSTQGRNLRIIPFDFPLSDAVQARQKNLRAGVQLSGVPIDLKVSVSELPGDAEPDNNSLGLRLRAVTQRRKILLLDGRPRWETRYLRNMFDRDEQWDLSTVVAGATAGESGFVRGDGKDQIPTDLSLLSTYDLIIFGEVPLNLLHPEEVQAIRDFVEKRGGALVFIDGPRGFLKQYTDTPLGPLFPVAWKGAPITEGITHFVQTDRARSLAPFALAPEAAASQEIWRNLPTPHWLSGAAALPGSEVLVEAETPKTPGGRSVAIAYRTFGAGRVFYHAFEDSWRWRYQVADQYHVRYWNQIADWIAELPFAVRDKFVSLDAGAITYRPGDSAEIRVRLRDGTGKPVTNTVTDAVLYHDGLRVATIRLSPEENAGGLFRGRTAALDPGEYEVAVETAAIPEQDAKARTSFKVEPRETGELTQLSLNEDLLRQMSVLSGGQYFREENIDRLVDALAPLSHGRVIESETILWQSYWWFSAILLLLTLEWALRKRFGML